MSGGKGLSLFLIDGQPSGRIACEIFNWTGKAYKIPRARLKDSASRPELFKAGVYLLFGRDEADPEMPVVYVGEAEEVFKRLLQHQEKDFWNDVVLFISKDENLNKAHIKFLEFKLFDAIRAAGRAKLLNGNTPNQPAISELEQAVMEEFLENLKVVVSTLGYRVFEPLARPIGEVPVVTDDHERVQVKEGEFFASGTRGAEAQAVMTDEGLVVRKGSLAAGQPVPSMPKWAAGLRQSLQESGVLQDSEGNLVFTKDYLASSPTAAAAIVLARSANGRIEWKDAAGNSLKDYEEGNVAS